MAAIAAVPAITLLELGHDTSLPYGVGRIGRYDRYRFINGQRVTQYREQMAPTASQPASREINAMRELGVFFLRDEALRESLERLQLAGFDRRGEGEIALSEVMPGGTAYGGASRVYWPGDGLPSLQLCRSGGIHDSVLQILEAELDLEELGARQALGAGAE